MAHLCVSCGERRELERLIHNCVSAMSATSRSAARVAREQRDSGPILELLRADYAAKKARLETLRECLTIHLLRHGCGDPIDLSESPCTTEPDLCDSTMEGRA
jgi:hypothetical protein